MAFATIDELEAGLRGATYLPERGLATALYLSLTTAGDRAKLCPECRTVRGAIASGKLTRETVNIEGGCLTLMTSNDPAMVAKLRRLLATQNAAHKS